MSGSDSVAWAHVAPILEMVCVSPKPLVNTVSLKFSEQIEMRERERNESVGSYESPDRSHKEQCMQGWRQKLQEEDERIKSYISQFHARLEKEGNNMPKQKSGMRQVFRQYRKLEERQREFRQWTEKELARLQSTVRTMHKVPTAWKEYHGKQCRRPTVASPARSSSRQWDAEQSHLREVQRRILRLQTEIAQLQPTASIVTSMIKAKEQPRHEPDLKAHLRHSRRCQASDPRDRIYAFLGLADPGYIITADYTRAYKIEHALLRTAQRIIEHEGTLAILEHAGRGSGKTCPLLAHVGTGLDQPGDGKRARRVCDAPQRRAEALGIFRSPGRLRRC